MYKRIFNQQVLQSDIAGEIPVISATDSGRQYYNSADDKHWTTEYVNGVLTLVEVKQNPVRLFLGKVLPTLRKPQTLLLDSGICEDDISFAPLVFNSPAGYYFKGAFFVHTTGATEVLMKLGGVTTICDFGTMVANQPKFIQYNGPIIDADYSFEATALTPNGTFRFVCLFERFEESTDFPVSTILDVTMHATGYLILTFSDDMAASVVTINEHVLTVNGVVAVIDEITKDTESVTFLVPVVPFVFGDEVRLTVKTGVIKNKWGGNITPIYKNLVVNVLQQGN